jgi:hypothetical protein
LEQIIEQSFHAEPDYNLPPGFAERVTLAILQREASKTLWPEYFSFAAILVLLLAIASGIYYIFDQELLLNSVRSITENILPIVFIGVILGFVLFADRVLLRLLFSRWNKSESLSPQ